ncbi:MAG: hypothetical protein ABID38_04370 [Candidatus Diapherotrites archaeon]
MKKKPDERKRRVGVTGTLGLGIFSRHKTNRLIPVFGGKKTTMPKFNAITPHSLGTAPHPTDKRIKVVAYKDRRGKNLGRDARRSGSVIKKRKK